MLINGLLKCQICDTLIINSSLIFLVITSHSKRNTKQTHCKYFLQRCPGIWFVFEMFNKKLKYFASDLWLDSKHTLGPKIAGTPLTIISLSQGV